MERPEDVEGARVLPGDDTGASILHVDMDAFFASVELAERPGLRGQPLVVGGRERGVVLAATYEARAFGIRSGMPMASALARLPSVVVVPPDHERYRVVSHRVMAILADVTPLVQQVSVDEAFLDVAGARRLLGSPATIGAAIRNRIREELGLPASVGAAATMSLAKIASQRAKPDGMLVVPPEASTAFLHPLPVSVIWGVGEATGERLAELGVRTVGELAAIPLRTLAAKVGAASAHHLHELAWARDARPVTPTRVEKSVSHEHTFPTDVHDRDELARTVLAQSHAVARRLRAGGMLARGVTIKVRHADFTTLTRSRRLEVPTDVAAELYRSARGLLAALELPPIGVRLIGVRADDVTPAASTPVQPLLGGDDGAHRAIETALDDVGRRFGSRASTAASLLPARAADPAADAAPASTSDRRVRPPVVPGRSAAVADGDGRLS
ncbi:DNA polymerase-4 [Salana multivorans]|mgnify:CR=1 FL=1|uniref:DNA polymerase IV n=1 Tax=Salana multivorans TaxID=120377 RepID=A0A3N2D260_9MICO|nr:DNA polymerase IV [Salana multivorans]OJX95615.1 MAG: DNA polymerase IV [Micrococcales bacterium 73-15]ROR93853.1 DNA polymerase-4 [Salana multivorans]